MSLLSSIKSAVGKAKDTFLPSAAVAEQRRIDTFGTSSKTVAASVIVGTAVAAIAAPAAITKVGGISQVANKVVTSIGNASLGTKVAIAVATPAAIGTIVREPATITKAPAAIANFEKNVYELAKDPSVANVKDLVTENPIIAGGVALAVTGASLGSAAVIASNLSNTSALKENTASMQLPSESKYKEIKETPLSSPSYPMVAGSDTPVTPATQVVGKSASSSIAKRSSKTRARTSNISNNLRVQIINQPKSLYTHSIRRF